MALQALDGDHAAQILAGTIGRLAGHKFEEQLTDSLNALGKVPFRTLPPVGHLDTGIPAQIVANYISSKEGFDEVELMEAWWLGGLATGRGGTPTIGDTGIVANRSKSDVVLRITNSKMSKTVGLGIKTCAKSTPTNAQVFFTTAVAFCDLIGSRIESVPDVARVALREFCGDSGFMPGETGTITSSIERYFWEEMNAKGRVWWEEFFERKQREVTALLLKFAYLEDPVPPSYITHQRVKPLESDSVPLATYSIEEFLDISQAHSGFHTKPYRVLKGRFRDPNTWHQAPRFGFIQFQRGGQKQHPTQLQFNLKAGYFNS
jgi:hypothetical protein